MRRQLDVLAVHPFHHRHRRPHSAEAVEHETDGVEDGPVGVEHHLVPVVVRQADRQPHLERTARGGAALAADQPCLDPLKLELAQRPFDAQQELVVAVVGIVDAGLVEDQGIGDAGDAHVGFIDWDEYLRNRATLRGNAAAFLESGSRTAAPREGAALLQSRVICGHCGRRMGMKYNRALPHRNRPARYFYVCGEDQARYGRKTCQTMRGDLVDAEISRFVIDALNRKNIDLALAVQQQVDVEFAEADAQRAKRIEGIRYEADLARRRFFEVDPANRLVAASLEADWNERLRDLEEACQEREARAAARDTELSARQVERIRELARDFERVWNAAQTGNADRKRLLGLLIEDATLTRNGSEVTIGLRMRGGRSLTLEPLQLPRPMAEIRKTPPETVAAVDRLLETHGDHGTARELNAMGCRNWKGEPYTAAHVGRVRRAYGLPNHVEREMKRLRDQGFATAREVAAQLGFNERVVRLLGRTATDARVERVIVPTEGRRRYCMYRANCAGETAPLSEPSSGD